MVQLTHRIGIFVYALGAMSLVGCNDSPRSPDSAKAPSHAISPEELLAKVRSKYAEAKSYSDNASLKQRGVNRSRGTITEMPFTYLSSMFERPNRYAITYEDAVAGSQGKTKYRVVSDGKRIRSSASQLPEQIHEAIAPRETTTDNLIPEPELRSAILQVALENLFPQLAMMLTPDVEQAIFPRATQLEMLSDEKIGDDDCYRIRLTEPEGPRVLWIDKDKLLLRRMEIPTESQRDALDPAGQFVNFSVDLDFENISLDAEFADAATRLDVPEDGRLVRRFIPPPPTGPSDVLGRSVKEFGFTDAQGTAVTPSSLEGKIAVLDFWSTDCPPCKENTPALEAAYQQLKDLDDVVFYAVSTDPKGLATPAVEKVLQSWGGSFPLLRDFEKHAYYQLDVRATPTLMVIGPGGRLQAQHVGILEDAEDLVAKVRSLRDGGDLVEQAKREHDEQLKQYEMILDAATLKTSLVDDSLPVAELAPRKLPEHLQVEEWWSSKLANLSAPGDVQVVVERAGERIDVEIDSARVGQVLNRSIKEILVLDAGDAVVRFDAEGKFLGRVQLPKHSASNGGFIRTTVDAEGASWYLVSGVGWQQVFLYDKDWKLKLSFPDESHSGVGDARFIDFKNHGLPSVVVGYWGGRGIQAGSLEGQLQWTNRHLDHVLQIANHPVSKSPDQSLWCTSTRGTVLEISADGKSQQEFPVVGHSMIALAVPVGAVGGNCGLGLLKSGHCALVTFGDMGKVEWSHELPPGEYSQPIPPIQTMGQTAYDTYRVVAGPDGSLHFIDLEGELVDRFDYGKSIAGLAAVPSAEGTILLVSAGNRLTAWRIAADSAP